MLGDEENIQIIDIIVVEFFTNPMCDFYVSSMCGGLEGVFPRNPSMGSRVGVPFSTSSRENPMR